MVIPVDKQIKAAGGTLSSRYPNLLLYCEFPYAVGLDPGGPGGVEGLTVREAIQRHIRLYGFGPPPTPEQMKAPAYPITHDFAHMLVGMAFMKLGYQPNDFDFGANGNFQVEALTLALELRYLSPGVLNNDIKHSLASGPGEFFNNYSRLYFCETYGGHFDVQTLSEAVEKVNESSSPRSLFQARQDVYFDNPPESLRVLPSLPERTRHGERVPTLYPLPRPVVEAIFQVIAPALEKMQTEIYEKGLLSAKNKQELVDEYYANLKMKDLWQTISASKVDSQRDYFNQYVKTYRIIENLHRITGRVTTIDLLRDRYQLVQQIMETGQLDVPSLENDMERNRHVISQTAAKLKSAWLKATGKGEEEFNNYMNQEIDSPLATGSFSVIQARLEELTKSIERATASKSKFSRVISAFKGEGRS